MWPTVASRADWQRLRCASRSERVENVAVACGKAVGSLRAALAGLATRDVYA